MGMGYGANMEMVISDNDLKKVVPEEYQAFFNMLENLGISFENVANAISNDWEMEDIEEEQEKEVREVWLDLQTAFHEKTSIHLWMGYHDSNDYGSRYDDVDGGFFGLSWWEVLEYTKDFKELMNRFSAKPELKCFVTYG